MQHAKRTSNCPGDGRGCVGRRAFAVVVLAAMTFAAGCAAPGTMFETERKDLVWPPPPETPRIRYVGSIRTSEDLQPGRGFGDSVREFIFGADSRPGLEGPRFAVTSADGNRLFVADPGQRCVHLLDLLTREWREITDLGGQRMLSPVGLCRGSEGSIYVCDSEDESVHRISDADGALIESVKLPPEVLRPVAVAYDVGAAEIYVVDARGHDLAVIGRDGALHRIIGTRGTGTGGLNFPCAVTLHGDRVWVADSGNARVQAFDRTGKPVLSFGRPGDAPGDMALPKGIACDGEGHVYVIDGRFELVQVFDDAGRLLLVVGQEGSGPGEFWLPSGIWIDPQNRIWICDSYNKRIQVFDYLRSQLASESRPASEPATRPERN